MAMLPLVKRLLAYTSALLFAIGVVAAKIFGFSLLTGAGFGVVLIGGLFAYGFVIRFKCPEVPGPTPHLFTGHYLEIFTIGLPVLLRQTAAEYGSVCRVFYGRTARVVVSDPDVIQKCNTLQFQTFHDRPVPLTALRTSTGLLMSRGNAWKRDRNAIVPAFNNAQLQSFMPAIEAAVDTFVAHLDRLTYGSTKPAEDVNVMTLWAGLTLEIFGVTSLGKSFGTIDKPLALQHPVVGAAMALFESFKPNPKSARFFQVLATFPFLKPFRNLIDADHVKRTLNCLQTLDTSVMELVQTRRADPDMAGYKDFLTYLILAKTDEAEGKMSDIEVRDQMITFLLAGYETTAVTLTFTTFLLSLPENKFALDKALEEIARLTKPRAAAGGDDAKSDGLSLDDLAEFEYLDAIINEAMRMYPPFQVIRDIETDCKVGPYNVPAGSEVVFSALITHYDPKLYPEPEKFKPERFLKSNPECQKRHKYAHFPFGMGPRMCIGLKFAMQEAKTALIRVLPRFSFHISPNITLPIAVVQGITLSSKQTITVTIKPTK